MSRQIVSWKSDASISECGKYRLWLTRERFIGRGTCYIIGLNPSTADARVDDNTIRRECALTMRLGHRKLFKINLFTARATKPSSLYNFKNPVGPYGPKTIRDTFKRVRKNDTVVCAWGANPFKKRVEIYFTWQRQVDYVLQKAFERDIPLHCLGLTKHGQPRHPLYLPSDVELVKFPYE